MFTPLRGDPRTQDCCECPIKEGKAQSDIGCCLKRYAAREVFHLVEQLQSEPCSWGCDVRRRPVGLLRRGVVVRVVTTNWG